MVAPTPHITQQNFLIGSYLEIKFLHWSRQCHQYLCPYTISPYEIFTTHSPYTYGHITHLTILWKNLQAYNIQHSVPWKKEHKTQHVPSFRNCVATQQVSHHSFPNLHHIQFTEYMFRNPAHFFQKELITT